MKTMFSDKTGSRKVL